MQALSPTDSSKKRKSLLLQTPQSLIVEDDVQCDPEQSKKRKSLSGKSVVSVDSDGEVQVPDKTKKRDDKENTTPNKKEKSSHRHKRKSMGTSATPRASMTPRSGVTPRGASSKDNSAVLTPRNGTTRHHRTPSVSGILRKVSTPQ
jgi:hypothetical protein